MQDFSTKNIIDAIRFNEQKNRRRNLIILTISVLLGLLFFGTSLFHIHEDHKEIASEHQEKVVLAKENLVLAKTISREDSVRRIVSEFLESKNRGDLQKIGGLFADTLNRYFTFINKP